MLESVIAILVVAFLFFVLFRLSHLLTVKILLEHASMRVARARAVGFNEFMCLKAGRICVIPVSGKRLQPAPDDERQGIDELAIAHMYLRTLDGSYADGLLQYEHWDKLEITPGHGGASHARFDTDLFKLRGEAEVDSYPIYLYDQGL